LNHDHSGAVGRRLGNGSGPETKLDIEIVGVVANSLYEGPREGVRRQVFVRQSGNGGSAIDVRAGLGSSSAYAALRSEVKKLDAAMPVSLRRHGLRRGPPNQGLRIALGARPGSVIWLMMREVLLPLAIGLAVGVPSAIGLGRFVGAQLYGIKSDSGFAVRVGRPRAQSS
jgi:hypothetical protein